MAMIAFEAVVDPENWTRVAETGRWLISQQEVQDDQEEPGASGVVQGEGGAGGGAGRRDSERAGVAVWRAPDAGEPVEAAAGEGGPAGVSGEKVEDQPSAREAELAAALERMQTELDWLKKKVAK